ncbi:Uncharacterised protein [Mycobacterium tuberculosis]|nr:Uncharacterised protein [Mycobacterium tuberculosis]
MLLSTSRAWRTEPKVVNRIRKMKPLGRRDLHAVGPADHDRNAPVAVDHGAGALALDLDPQGILHVFHRQAVAPRAQAVDDHAQVLHAVVLDGVHVLVALHRLHQRLDLARQLVELVELGA